MKISLKDLTKDNWNVLFPIDVPEASLNGSEWHGQNTGGHGPYLLD